MPGMMDTVLNVGCNDVIVEAISSKTTPRFAYDCYRRLLSMFGDVVLGLPHSEFEHVLEEKKKEKGVKFDVELTADDLKDVVTSFKDIFTKHGKELPQHPLDQLRMGVDAVFQSHPLSSLAVI